MFKKSRVYLDYAAATPLSKSAFLAMKPYLTESYGNGSAIHKEGAVARAAIESARDQIAKTLQVRPEFVTFTSGGTESNNIAIIGTIEGLHQNGRSYSDMEVVTTKIEHPSVLETMKALAARGVTVKYAPVTKDGFVHLEALTSLLCEKTVLFSTAYANSEIGVIQKVRTIKKVLEAAESKYGTKILFHVDAAQAPLWVSCQFDSVGADAVALDVGKCNGPKGVGVLVLSRRAHPKGVLFGGGQENGLRPGTENVAGIVGASRALREAQKDFKLRAEKVSKIRDAGIAHLLSEIPQLVVNGVEGEDRLANNINISIPGLDTEFATVVLDTHGFAVSTKSACAGAGSGESVVVREISDDPVRAQSTLRISLSPHTTVAQLKSLTQVLKRHVALMSTLTKG